MTCTRLIFYKHHSLLVRKTSVQFKWMGFVLFTQEELVGRVLFNYELYRNDFLLFHQVVAHIVSASFRYDADKIMFATVELILPRCTD